MLLMKTGVIYDSITVESTTRTIPNINEKM